MKSTSICPRAFLPSRSAPPASMQGTSCSTARTASSSSTETSPPPSATRPSAASKILPASPRPQAAAQRASQRNSQNRYAKSKGPMPCAPVLFLCTKKAGCRLLLFTGKPLRPSPAPFRSPQYTWCDNCLHPCRHTTVPSCPAR